MLPAFVAAYTACYPLDKTWHGKVANGSWAAAPKAAAWPRWKTNCFYPRLSEDQPPANHAWLALWAESTQTNYWIHRLLPVLRRALVALDMAPERDASRVATSPLMLEERPRGGASMGPSGAANARRMPRSKPPITVGRRKPIRIRTCF